MRNFIKIILVLSFVFNVFVSAYSSSKEYLNNQEPCGKTTGYVKENIRKESVVLPLALFFAL